MARRPAACKTAGVRDSGGQQLGSPLTDGGILVAACAGTAGAPSNGSWQGHPTAAALVEAAPAATAATHRGAPAASAAAAAVRRSPASSKPPTSNSAPVMKSSDDTSTRATAAPALVATATARPAAAPLVTRAEGQVPAAGKRASPTPVNHAAHPPGADRAAAPSAGVDAEPCRGGRKPLTSAGVAPAGAPDADPASGGGGGAGGASSPTDDSERSLPPA